jgi:UDP-N-acetylmuramoyl-L-alanyl-D-glutamate--2,6-diaminopimelate ligase
VSARLSTVSRALVGSTLKGGDCEVLDVTHDSRDVRAGSLFCAVIGSRQDGHDHAAQAVHDGAVALLVERDVDIDVPQLLVRSVRENMGLAASLVHDHPSRTLSVVGVTGTNGKTTVTTFLEAAFARQGLGTGVIGTLGTRIHGRNTPGARTTPEGTDLQRLLREMSDRGVDAVAMEVSSHALDLHRVRGTRFKVAAFTNLSQDHLDWHGDMDRYLAAKARLFTPEFSDHGIVDLDAPYGPALAAMATIPLTTLGSSPEADLLVSERRVTREGSSAVLGLSTGSVEVRTRTIGRFNLDNALVAVATAVAAGIEPSAAVEGVALAEAPPGRLERVVLASSAVSPMVLVDYAHTPDAVASVVAVGRELAGDSRLLVLVGAGGDRDRVKRSLMGAAAAGADHVVVTDDNPRSEDPAAIRAAVADGVLGAGGTCEVIADRRAAVERLVAAASPEDVILILGRGHETHQERDGRFTPLDDRELARSALKARS